MVYIALTEQRQRIDHQIDRYLQQLDQADTEDQHIELESASVKEALKQLQQEKTALDKVEAQMEARGRNQACMTAFSRIHMTFLFLVHGLMSQAFSRRGYI